MGEIHKLMYSIVEEQNWNTALATSLVCEDLCEVERKRFDGKLLEDLITTELKRR